MIEPTDADDPRFVALASRLINAVVTANQPKEVYLIRIDQWFDAKWRNFAGKMLGAFGVHGPPVTLPPFHPHRVLEERHYSAVPGSSRFVPTHAPPLHIEQGSAKNLNRSIFSVSRSAIFFWYSSSTATLDQGSTMLYGTNQETVFLWYAGFRKTQDWKLARHRGISPFEVQHLLEFAPHQDQLVSSKSN